MVDHPDSVRTGVNRTNSEVTGSLVDAAGAGNYFETDQAMGDTPTLYMEVTCNNGYPVKAFLLEEVAYYMNPTNRVTYQLYLLEQASADDAQQLSDVVFASPAAQADSSIYFKYGHSEQTNWAAPTEAFYLPRIVNLTTPGRLYYMVDWSGAPANTPGYIKIRGRLLK